MRRMWMRLALAWGCTVREAQARCDCREFAEWIAFYRLEPWGSDADDRRHAIACTVTGNGLYKHKFEPKDFRINDTRTPKPSPEELKQKLRSVFRTLNGNRRKPQRQADDDKPGVQQRPK